MELELWLYNIYNNNNNINKIGIISLVSFTDETQPSWNMKEINPRKIKGS